MGITKAILNGEVLKERNGKIPIRIIGYNSFWIGGGIRDLTFGTFCFPSGGDRLEDSIKYVMEMLKFNAEIYLMRMVEGMEGGNEQDTALKLINCKGNLEDLFFVEYEKCWQEKVEPLLGRYSNLEKKILKS